MVRRPDETPTGPRPGREAFARLDDDPDFERLDDDPDLMPPVWGPAGLDGVRLPWWWRLYRAWR